MKKLIVKFLKWDITSAKFAIKADEKLIKKLSLFLFLLSVFIFKSSTVYALDYSKYNLTNYNDFYNKLLENTIIDHGDTTYQPIKKYSKFKTISITHTYVACWTNDKKKSSSLGTDSAIFNSYPFECYFSHVPLKYKKSNNLVTGKADGGGYLVSDDGNFYNSMIYSLYMNVNHDFDPLSSGSSQNDGVSPNYLNLTSDDFISNYDIYDYDTNELISSTDYVDNSFNPDSSINIAPGESIMFYNIKDDVSSYETRYSVDGYYYLQYQHYSSDLSSYEKISSFSNIDKTDSMKDSVLVNHITFSESEKFPFYVYQLVNRDNVPINFKYYSSDINVVYFSTNDNVVEVTDKNGNKYTFKNNSKSLLNDATLDYGATNGSKQTSSSPFSSLSSILNNIVDLVKLFGTVFVVIGSLITIFFNSMPNFISVGVQCLFFIGIILLVIKALK